MHSPCGIVDAFLLRTFPTDLRFRFPLVLKAAVEPYRRARLATYVAFCPFFGDEYVILLKEERLQDSDLEPLLRFVLVPWPLKA